MEPADILLLDGLKAAIHGEKAVLLEISGKTGETLLRRAVQHEILPLIFAAYGSVLNPAVQQAAFWQTAEQTVKNQVFFHVYKQLCNEGIFPLVLKGPVCAALYPDPALRLFSDVDLLIRPEDFTGAKNVLTHLGFCAAKSGRDEKEATFYAKNSPLVLELHGELFPNSQPYGAMNTLFSLEHKQPRKVLLQGETVYTLDVNDTFLYLLLHMVKHVLHGGCGIRTVCDLLLFAQKYAEQLDVLWLHRCCETLSLSCFLTALFAIGEHYLGIEKPENLAVLWVHPIPDETALLRDILAGGVHGGAEKSRLHGANLTLQAFSAEQSGKRGRFSVLRAAFPRAETLNCEPHELPAAWGRRLWRYGVDRMKNRGSFVSDITCGKQRLVLLRQYRILK